MTLITSAVGHLCRRVVQTQPSEGGDRLNPRGVVTDSTLYGADGTAWQAPTVCDHLFDPGRVFAQPPNKTSNTDAVPQQLSRALSVHATPHSMLHITDSRTLLSQTVKSWIDQRVVTDSTLLREATAPCDHIRSAPARHGDKLSAKRPHSMQHTRMLGGVLDLSCMLR